MTVTELRDALMALHWTPQDLADETGADLQMARRWARGSTAVPVPIAAALSDLVNYHRAHPFPHV